MGRAISENNDIRRSTTNQKSVYIPVEAYKSYKEQMNAAKRHDRNIMFLYILLGTVSIVLLILSYIAYTKMVLSLEKQNINIYSTIGITFLIVVLIVIGLGIVINNIYERRLSYREKLAQITLVPKIFIPLFLTVTIVDPVIINAMVNMGCIGPHILTNVFALFLSLAYDSFNVRCGLDKQNINNDGIKMLRVTLTGFMELFPIACFVLFTVMCPILPIVSLWIISILLSGLLGTLTVYYFLDDYKRFTLKMFK